MNIAFFDFDGTITHKDTYTKFVLFATPKPRLILGKLLLLPSIVKYKLGRLHGRNIRTKMTKLAFKGMSSENLHYKGEQYAKQVIPTYIRPSAMKKIAWHQSQGDTVVIVSASLNIYLQPWCDKHSLSLICTEVEFINGMATGNTIDGDCSSLEKDRRIKLGYTLEEYNIVYAYGDTSEDKELLELAQPQNRFYRYFDDS